jgi:hypothetical protein
MKNSSTFKLLDDGKVILNMTSKKPISLNNMFLVADIIMNLMSGLLLSKNSSKLVFKSEKFIFSKDKVFIKEGHLSDNLFKINVMTIVTMDNNNNNNNNNNTYSSYLLESCDMWHDKLGHVNYNLLNVNKS